MRPCCAQRGWAESSPPRASAPARDQAQLRAGWNSSFPALCLAQLALSSTGTEVQCPPDSQCVLGLQTNVSLRAQHHHREQGLWGKSHVQSPASWEGVSQRDGLNHDCPVAPRPSWEPASRAWHWGRWACAGDAIPRVATNPVTSCDSCSVGIPGAGSRTPAPNVQKLQVRPKKS